MSGVTDELPRLHMVLINDEGQYSLWPITKEIPAGWRAAGKEGQQDECLEYIEQSWVDMRPLSLVKIMEVASAVG
ncbi:MbtH family protein [Rhizobium leguminosarum]|uniref:MbtH family protein n=1 Tax=Rhizobium leguminosarum TaxID=384 RepID=UPI003F9509EB